MLQFSSFVELSVKVVLVFLFHELKKMSTSHSAPSQPGEQEQSRLMNFLEDAKRFFLAINSKFSDLLGRFVRWLKLDEVEIPFDVGIFFDEFVKDGSSLLKQMRAFARTLAGSLVTIVVEIWKAVGHHAMRVGGVVLINILSNDLNSWFDKGHWPKWTHSRIATYSVLGGLEGPYWVFYLRGAHHHDGPGPSTSVEEHVAAGISSSQFDATDQTSQLLESQSDPPDLGSDGETAAQPSSDSSQVLEVIVTIDNDSEDASRDCVQRLQPERQVHGSKVLHKFIQINPDSPEELKNCISQLGESMRLAHEVDKNCVLQLGSYAVFKYTDARLKMWKVQDDWTPKLLDIRRRWNLFDYISGRSAEWIITGLNLEGAALRATTKDKSEVLKVEKLGDNMYLCKEPNIIQNLAPQFEEKVFIAASKDVRVEGVNLKLQSGVKDAERAYWISVAGALVPGRWILIIPVLLLLGRFAYIKDIIGIIGDLDVGGDSVSRDFWRGGKSPDTSWKDQIRSQLRTSLEIFINLYLIHLFTIFSIYVKNLWIRSRAPLGGRQTIFTSLASLGINSPRAVGAPLGVTQLNDSVWSLYSPSGIPAMEIIFFPGLQLGDFNNSFWKTWLATDDEHVIWPKEMLSNRFPNARILCVSYNSCAAEIAGLPDNTGIDTLGKILVRDIIQDNKYNIGQHCPVFLVGHSLGGTVVKQLILSALGKVDLFNEETSREDMDTNDKFLDNIRGTFYYATPNGGSRISELASQIPSASPILGLLKEINIASGMVNEEFRRNFAYSSFAVAEGCKIHYGDFHATVVDETSATTGHAVGQTCLHTTANHFTVCRAVAIKDVASAMLLDFIARALSEGATSYPQEADLILHLQKQSLAFGIPPSGGTKVVDKGDIEHPEEDPKEGSLASTFQPLVKRQKKKKRKIADDESNLDSMRMQASTNQRSRVFSKTRKEKGKKPSSDEHVELAEYPKEGNRPQAAGGVTSAQFVELGSKFSASRDVQVSDGGTVTHPQQAAVVKPYRSLPFRSSLPGLTTPSDEQAAVVKPYRSLPVRSSLPGLTTPSDKVTTTPIRQEADSTVSSTRPPNKKVLLFGRIGGGKSTVANALVTGAVEPILFHSSGSAWSCTNTIQKESGRGWTVVDTVGVKEETISATDHIDLFKYLSKQGRHEDRSYSHIIYVQRAGRIGAREELLWTLFRTIFEGAEGVFVVLFTSASQDWFDKNRDQLPASMRDYPILVTDIPPPSLERRSSARRNSSISKLEVDLENLFRDREYRNVIPKIATMNEDEQEAVFRRIDGLTVATSFN